MRPGRCFFLYREIPTPLPPPMADPWHKPLASRHGRGKTIDTFLSKGASAPFAPLSKASGRAFSYKGRGILPMSMGLATTSLSL